jgi:excisionase family DNA binding protein
MSVVNYRDGIKRSDPDSHKKLAYSIAEASAMLGMGQRTIHSMIARGELRSVKAGRRRLIPLDALQDLLAAPSTTKGEG